MPEIRFGPAGLGGVNEAISNLERYHKLGLEACEIAFTYGIYIKKKEDAGKIGEAAKKLGIYLSIHAPYYINLNSEDKKKLKKSKERILECLKVGTWLQAKKIVFHPGFYGKIKRTLGSSYDISSEVGSRLIKEETYNNSENKKFSDLQKTRKEQAFRNIKKAILELKKEKKENKYTPELAPETTGKINVFGSVDEIAQLVNDTKCSFCIDFAHILAREKNYMFTDVFKKFEKHKDIHIHFSGINYGEKGEKSHKKTPESELIKLIKNLPKNKNITIINESPFPIEDSISGLKIKNKLNN